MIFDRVVQIRSSRQKREPSFWPNVKKPTSGAKQGGGGGSRPLDTSPRIRTCNVKNTFRTHEQHLGYV